MIIRNLTDQVFNESTLGLCLIDLEGTILQVNPAFEALTGLSSEQTLSRSCSAVIPDDSCGTSRCPLLRLRGGEEIRPWERTLKLPDGRSVTCRANAFPIRDENQQIVGVFECLEVVQPAASRRSDLGSQDAATSYLEDLVALVGRLPTPDVSLGRKLQWIAAAMAGLLPGSYCQIWLQGLDLPTALVVGEIPKTPAEERPRHEREQRPSASSCLAAAAGPHSEAGGDPWVVPIPAIRAGDTRSHSGKHLGHISIYRSGEGPGELPKRIATPAKLLAQLAAQLLTSAKHEQGLQNQLWLQERILAALPFPVYWKRPNYTYAGCNRAMLSVCGLSSHEEILGKKGEDLELAFDRLAPLTACDELVITKGEGATNIELPVVLPDGTEAIYLISKRPLCDPTGRIAGLVGTAVDVTEQKRASEELARVKAALDDSSAAVLIADVAGRVTYLNLASGRLLEHTRDSINAEGLSAVFVSSETLSRLIKALEALETWEEELELRTRAGKAFPAQIRAAPLLSDDLQVSGMLLTITDLTKSRALQQQLMQAQKMESVGQLAAGIAHEINTPSQYVSDNVHFLKDAMQDIQALIGSLRVLLDEKPGTDPREAQHVADIQARIGAMLDDADVEFLEQEIPSALDQAMEGLQRIGTIVRAMKEFSHPGTKEKQAIDINDAIRSTITVTTHHWKYVAKLTTEFASDLPPLACHPGELNQAVLNLIVNAADAVVDARGDMPDDMGEIHISTRKAGSWIEIRVADDGSGIPAEVKDRIFEPFFTTKEVGKGSGQGLAIVYAAIVDKHGGEIRVESELGEGTTFIIRLPATPIEGRAAVA